MPVTFKGDLWFLSNFYPRQVTYNTIVYRTREHAFQVQKFLDSKIRLYIMSAPSPAVAKQRAKEYKHLVRPDWKDISIRVMREIVQAFFTEHLDMAVKLYCTGDKRLSEENTWGDVFWGTVNGEGENWLGKILMEVRFLLPAIHGEGLTRLASTSKK